MIWNKLSEKLAPINKKVFILHKDCSIIKEARLRVCDNMNFLESYEKKENNTIKSGDLYWLIPSFRDDDKDPVSSALTVPEHYPYWLEEEALAKATTETVVIEEPDEPVEHRSEILDL